MERRIFLQTVGGAGLVAAGCASTSHGAKERAGADNEAEVTPGEDLMQEHGVLERILLIYDEVGGRIDAGASFDSAIVVAAARIVQRFIESYHEKNEETFVFPRLQAANRNTDLVAILLRQHQRGRQITDQIVRAAGTANPELSRALRSFVRMYRPHAAREDTVLFPAFRDVVGRAGYDELGEQFEDQEHRLFGEHGFAETVAEVARLETALGIANLDSFTPA